METLEEGKSTLTAVNRSSKKLKISLPSEVFDDILSRLPVKSILRCKSVSKLWLSRISDPLFTKLYITRSTANHRTALFISAYDSSTKKRHFLSAAHDGGPVTHLMTLDNPYCIHFTEAEHLNGLVFFTCTNWASGKACQYVVNPSTRKIFQLPDPPTLACGHSPFGCLFGFDESRNDHKILMARQHPEPTKDDIMIFSMSNYSWRKIDAESPVGFKWYSMYRDIYGSVCINSVIHVMPRGSFDILAFDLRTEKFSVIGTPQGVVPREPTKTYTCNGIPFHKGSRPFLIKSNEYIGVVCHDRVVQSNEMDVWILHDYKNRVWVREVIRLVSVPWTKLDHPYPLDVDDMDEIIFTLSTVSRNVICLPIYNKKSKRCKVLRFTLGDGFLNPQTVDFKQIKRYTESIMPL